jgi:hypothetical protein
LKVDMDVYQGDPFQRPYWRHERVLQLRKTVPPQRCSRHDDRWIQKYRAFLIDWDKGEAIRPRLLHANPGLYYAHRIHQMRQIEPEVALMMEARLLAGTPIVEIAHTAKTFTATVEWYEKLYFNVSKRLEHHDWIVKSVLLPSYAQSFTQQEAQPGDADAPPAKVIREVASPYLDMSLKFFAYFGGPLVCDVMISGFRRNRHVTSPEELSDYFNDQFSMHIQRRSAQAAMAFEVNKYNVMELFATHSRLIEIQRSGKGAEDRKTEFEKNVNALMSELPWSTGRAGAQLYEGELIGKYDESAAEVSAEESVEAGLGRPVVGMDELEGRDIFAERQKGQERHAITK